MNEDAEEKGSGEASVNPVFSLMDALNRHCRNIEAIVERRRYDYLRDEAREMVVLLSELRGTAYMGNF
jgi:hypothetical protein